MGAFPSILKLSLSVTKITHRVIKLSLRVFNATSEYGAWSLLSEHPTLSLIPYI